MQSFVYHAQFEPGDEGGIVVTFPDVPEAITQGDDEADARAMAEDALALGLLSYPQRGLPLPEPKHRGGDLIPIYVRPEDAAKLPFSTRGGSSASPRANLRGGSARTKKRFVGCWIRCTPPNFRRWRPRCDRSVGDW